MSLKPLIIYAVVFVLASVSPLGLRVANAVPILQLYLEGATYDYDTESWVLAPDGSSGGAPFRLWAIGNVAGPGGAGTISEVRLSVAFSDDFSDDLEITLKPTLVGGDGLFNLVEDSSVPDIIIPDFTPIPVDPEFLVPNELVRTSLNGELVIFDTGEGGLVTNGGIPVLSNDSALPSHGEYGPDTDWYEFWLGDFDQTDSHIGDFIGDFPTELFPESGQINAYEISVLNGSGATIHFDLFNHIGSENKAKAKFAPFSHDASIVPEPSSLVVWSLFCALGIAVQRWRRRRVS